MLFIALVVMGLFAYFKLPIKNFPNVEFPAVAVIVTRNGAAPAEMESQITRQVENSMAGLANVQNIASTITQGSSTTVVQFYLGTDLQKALDDVRTRTDQARADLPRDVDPPLVRRLEIDDQPIITYAVSAPAMSTRNCPGSSKTPLPARCRPHPALRRSAAWAAWTARSTSWSIPSGWPRRD